MSSEKCLYDDSVDCSKIQCLANATAGINGAIEEKIRLQNPKLPLSPECADMEEIEPTLDQLKRQNLAIIEILTSVQYCAIRKCKISIG